MSETKTEILNEILTDVKKHLKNINSVNSSLDDFYKIGEFFKMVGINDDIVLDLYTGCGFSDHTDFYSQFKGKKPMTGNANCTMSKIRGVSDAIIDFLECEIAKGA